MPTARRPKGMPVQPSPYSPNPILDDWLSIPLQERKWIAEDQQYGKLPGDEERYDDLLKDPSQEVRRMQSGRDEFLKNNPDYTYENKTPSVTDLYLKPIGQGIADTASDLTRIGADLLFRGKKPSLGEIFGQKQPKTKPEARSSHSVPDVSPAPPSNGKGIVLREPPSLDLPEQPKPPINAPPEPKKPTVSKGRATTVDIPELTPIGTSPKGTPIVQQKTRKRTVLNPEEEDHFKGWYDQIAKQNGLNPNPDDPQHKYDYRAAWRAGEKPGPDQHWSSKFKDDDHPNRFILDGQNILDTKAGRIVPSDQFNAVATKDQKRTIEQAMIQSGQAFSLPAPSIMDAYKVLPGMAEISNMTEQRQAKQLMEMQRPGATSPTASIPSMEPPQPLSLGQAFEEAGKSFARGSGNTAALVTKGVGLWARELDKQFGTDKKPDDYATFRLGQKISKWTNETFKGRPDLQKNFLLTTLFEGAGSSLPFLATGGAAAALGAGPGTTAAVTGALAGSAGLVEQAPQTSTEEQRRLGLVLGGALGLTEGIPIAELFNRMNSYSGGLLATSLKSGTVQAVEEAIQEAMQQVGENTVKKYIYGMLGQDLKEGVLEGAGSGGIVGFLTGFMMSGKVRIPATDLKGKAGPEQPPGAQSTNAPPPDVPPDLGEIAAQGGKEKVRPPKLGDIVNRKVQEIADQYPMPSLDVKQGEKPKLIKKGTQPAAPPALEPQAVGSTQEKSEPVKEQRKSSTPPPDAIDEDMREALDADLGLLDETPQEKPGGRLDPVAGNLADLDIPSMEGVQGPSVEQLHAMAEAKGMEWDNNTPFMDFTEEVTGKRHLDKLTGPERQRMADALEQQPTPDIATFDQPTIPGEGRLVQTRDGRYQMQRPDGTYVTNPVTGGTEFKTAEKAKAAYENTIDLAPREEPQAKEAPKALQAPPSLEQEATSTPVKKQEPEEFDYSSVQHNLSKEMADGVMSIGRQIPDEDLAEEGREDQPHLTVKFGLHTENVEDVRSLLESQPPITATVGDLSIFPATKDRDSDVLKADVESEDLRAFNQLIADSTKTTETQGEYKPHLTIAYVKPGNGERYTKVDNPLKGKTINIDRVAFSDKSGKQVEVQLKGKATAPTLEPPSTKTPAYTVESAELVPTRGADGRIQWVPQNVTREEFPAQETPSLEAPTTPAPAKPDKMVGPLQPGELSFEEFLQQARFYRSGKTKNAEVPGGERVILKPESTATNFRENSKNFLRGVYGNYIAKLRRAKAEGAAPAPPSLTPTEREQPGTTEPATLAAAPSLEGGPNEQTEQPRVEDARPPETASTQDVPGLEEPGTAQPVSSGPAKSDQRPANRARRSRDAATRSEGDAPRRDLSPERGGRPEDRDDAEPVQGPDAAKGHDYTLRDDYAIPSGQKTKYKANVDAIKLLKQIESEGRLATPAEQDVLAQYTGWGGIPQAFQWSYEWQKEYRELSELLTGEEYTNARASTPNAHYTDPSTIRAIYTGLEHLGFKRGRVLEPGAGIGHFFGVMPSGMASRSQRTAVEKDSISARITKQLYQNANVLEGAYEKQVLPDAFFDVAIGNVPFADVKPFDPHNQDLAKLNLSLHDYYFAKALSQVRPGGLVAFITSRYTMDKVNGKLRDYLAKQADLVGAIRLPNTQFKAIANTDVTTDVIVLKKREDGATPSAETWGTVAEVPVQDGTATVNEYFARHPENILGRLSLEGSQYRDKEITVTPDDRNVPAAMVEAFRRMPGNVYQSRQAPKSVTPRGILEAMEATDDVKDGAYTIQNNALYVRRGNQFVPMDGTTPTDLERAKGLIGLRDQVKTVLKSQLDGSSESVMQAERKELNKRYDRFQKKFGYVHAPANRKLFREDPDYGTLQSLEQDYDAKKKTAKKADIFTKRVIQHGQKIEKVETAKEAMLASLNETGALNLDRMRDLTGKSATELIGELKGLIYKNPEGGEWEPAGRYLSGNIRRKLKIAEAAAKTDRLFQENIDALQAAIPEDLEPRQISLKLGHGWVPTEVYAQFVSELLDVNQRSVTVNYNAAVGAFAVTANVSSGNVKNSKTYGTDRANAVDLIKLALDSKLPTIYDTHSDGSRTLNEKETLQAREKQQAIQDAFREWVWKDTDRATRLARKYNDEFNNIRLQQFDGSHLTLPGKNPAIKLRPHQKNAVWRALQEGNTLLAHVVGAGKTYTKIAIAMESRRLRLANKPMVVVPNHLVEYWRDAFLQLYPAANVLATTKEDFEQGNRRKLVGRIATGDWDAVIIAHSQFSRIPMSFESFETFASEQIEILENYLHELKADKKNNRNIIKEIEKAKARFESKLESRKAAVESRADDGVTFEETGVDMLLVDEADLFKNLWFPTRMSRVSGLPNTESQRSYDMFLKTNYLNKLTNQRGVMFGTGTPISNSMAEAFTMQRYLQPRALEQAGLAHFDAWARQFGNTVTSMELAADGSGYRPKTRFAEFVNVPELTQMLRQVMDVQLQEDLKLPVPKLRTGKPINVTVKASEPLKQYQASLVKRAEELKKGRVDPRKDNMLKITGDGRNAALDIRLRVPGAPEDPNGKVNAMVKRVVEEYKKSTPVKGTQLVFLDLSTPKAEGKKKASEDVADESDVELAEESTLRGSVYQDVRRKLIAGGIPANQIAFIHDADTDAKKTKLFADVNAGTIRVLMGSTEKMGAGTNVQQRMVALHNLDAPWRPRDIEQRNGRGIRQGNELYKADPDGFEFAVFNYATEAPSFDVYMWQTLESKARTIAQIMKGDPNIRTVQDVDTSVMSYAEMKAIASGNPMILERANKDIELRKLSLLRSAYQDTQRRIAYDLRAIPSQIDFERSHIVQFEKLERTADQHPADPFTVTVEGSTFNDKTEAGKALLKLATDALAANPTRDSILTYPGIGEYRGFPLHLGIHVDGAVFFKIGDSILKTTDFKPGDVKPENVMVRFENAIASLDSFMANGKKRIQALEKKQADMLEEQKKPFEHEAKIQALNDRLALIDNALDLTKKEENVVGGEEGGRSPLDILKSERGSIPASPFTTSGAGSKADADRYRQQRAEEEIGFQSADPEIEQRVRAAKQGAKPDSLGTRLKDNLAHVWRLVSREFEHLPDTAQFSRLRSDLLKLQKYKGIAADEVQRELASIIKPLNRKQYDQFEWKALLADLKQEAEAGRQLPFGYTAEKVEDDLESLDAAIARDPAVQQAWQKRQQLWKRLKGDYKASMESIGFDVSKKLTKQDYFRHQVLEHSREKALKGTGSKIRTPTGRGFLKSRHGSTMDINANYVQAEFEVMAQMVYDTQVAKVIKGVDQTLNIRKSLEAQAKTENNQALQAIIDAGDNRSALVDGTLKGFRKRLGMHMSRLRDALNMRADEPLTLQQIAEIAEDLENPAHLSARGVFKVINERKAYVDHLLGDQKVEWTDLIPETHDLWQPREGNVFYMADSVPANLAKALQESMLEETGLLAEKLRKVLAMGAPREQYVIPKEAKETLDALSHKEHSWFVEFNRQLLGHWKQLMLIAPRKIIRYNLRNLTGDADAMFVGNPGAFTKMRRAASDLLPVMFNDETLSGEVKEWVKRGGYGTTLQYQELGDLNNLKAFKLTLDRAGKGGVLGIPAKAWNTYWKAARLSTDYREAMMRYAAYLSYLEQMQENKGVPKNFGASKKETVMALPDIRDRAFKLSNELLGAYDRVSVAGQTIRSFWVPFFSWMEVNATRYGRLVGNALDAGHGGRVLGKGALITGKNAAAFLIKASFFWSTLQAWNYLLFGDDEDELKQTNPTVANRPHILFGRDDEGKIQYLAGIGALGDLLSWVGLDEFPGLVGDLMHDRMTIGEAIKNSAKAPVNRIWQGLTPAVKMPVELATRQTSYPDVFHWRPIQDRAEYLGYQTTLGPEIRAMMGKPGKPLYDVEDLAGLVVQRTDPAASAYYSWQTTERKYLERMGKDSPSVFWRSPRGEALQNWSLALKHKDKDAEAAWRERYIELEKEKHGAKFSESRMYKDIEQSLRSKAPLSGMSRGDRDEVLKKLDEEELRTLRRAEDYYRDTIMQVLPAARRVPFQRKLESKGWLNGRRQLPASLEP